jgi:hypothetical protein
MGTSSKCARSGHPHAQCGKGEFAGDVQLAVTDGSLLVSARDPEERAGDSADAIWPWDLGSPGRKLEGNCDSGGH